MALIPSVLGISPGDHGCGRTLTWLLQGAVNGGLAAVILREPHLSKPAYVELARRISPLFGAGLMLHASHDHALDVAEASGWGLHLPSTHDVAAARPRVRGLLGVSCHSREALQAAEDAGADYATLSPIHSPLSKPSDVRSTLEIGGLEDAISGITLPVFALGGMTGETAEALCNTDVHGVASLSYLFPTEADADVCEAHAATLCMLMKRRG
jgi:thiamine monophosphate synthase